MTATPETENILQYLNRIRANDGHIELKHDDNCDKPYCQFCVGGLFACTVCGSFEGATTTECPGKDMTKEQSDKVYAGELDFRNGAWIQLHSTQAPGWFYTSEGQEHYKLVDPKAYADYVARQEKRKRDA